MKHIRLMILSSVLTLTALTVGRTILMPNPVVARMRPIAQIVTPECKGLLQQFLDAGGAGNKGKMETYGTSYLEGKCRVGSLLSAMHYLRTHELSKG